MSSGQCWSLTSYCPVPGPVPTPPANRDDEPGFTVQMMSNDRDLALATGRTRGVVSPLGGLAAPIYQPQRNQGLGKKDFYVIIKTLKGLDGGTRRAVAIAPIVSMYRRNGPVMS